MEIKRKKITNEEIYETEQKLKKEISDFCESKKEDFSVLGYDLEYVFGQKENEAENEYAPYTDDEAKTYEAGYVSHAVISIKRKKTEEELAADAEALAQNRAMLENVETEEELDALQNEEELRVAEDMNRRLVAFTEMMLVRTYKSFWTEWVCLGDEITALESDLAEFREKLLERTNRT